MGIIAAPDLEAYCEIHVCEILSALAHAQKVAKNNNSHYLP